MMVSVVMLMLGSQVQMYAQKKGGPDFKRPEMEMKMDRRPDMPMDMKAGRQADIEKIQRYFRMKYDIRLSKKEAEKILWVQMREKNGKTFGQKRPQGMSPRKNK